MKIWWVTSWFIPARCCPQTAWYRLFGTVAMTLCGRIHCFNSTAFLGVYTRLMISAALGMPVLHCMTSLKVFFWCGTVKARRNTYGSHQSLPWGTSRELWKITPAGWSTGTILHGENGVFQSNRNDFPKVSFNLDRIWRHMGALFCDWKWIKWFRRLFSTKKIDHVPQFFLRAFSGAGGSCPFPDLHWWYTRLCSTYIYICQLYIFSAIVQVSLGFLADVTLSYSLLETVQKSKMMSYPLYPKSRLIHFTFVMNRLS
jgi:hypothetical protein